MRQKIDIEMKEIVCPVCGRTEHHLLHQESPFQMVKCSSCRFIFLNPRPTLDSLFHFYQTYLPEEASSIESWEKMMRPVFYRAANLLQRYRREGQLLDVGTGFGFFLVEMRRRGWEVIGVEVSNKAIDYAKNRLGLTLHQGPLERIGFPDQSFDVVTGFYVIEHLSEPMAFLKECYRILKPGGLLLVRYPETTPIKNLLRFLGIQNRLYDLPAHLADFSPKTIQECLRKVGFKKWRHLIGGYTLPRDLGKRFASIFFGNLAEGIYYLSLGKCLFPGVSKTVLAFKEEKR